MTKKADYQRKPSRQTTKRELKRQNARDLQERHAASKPTPVTFQEQREGGSIGQGGIFGS